MHVFPQNTLHTKRHGVTLHTTPVLVTPVVTGSNWVGLKNLLQFFNLQELEGQSGDGWQE